MAFIRTNVDLDTEDLARSINEELMAHEIREFVMEIVNGEDDEELVRDLIDDLRGWLSEVV